MKKLLLFAFAIAFIMSACVKKLTVNPNETIEFTLDTVRITAGSAQRIVPQNYSPELLNWTSSDSTTVGISATGLATGKKAGQSTITARNQAGNASATCLVIVSAAVVTPTSTQVGSNASDVGIGANGSVFIIGTEDVSPTGGFSILKVTGSVIEKMPECAGVRIAVTKDGVPWVVNKSKLVYQYNGRIWDVLPGSATDIGIGADNSVYAIGTMDVSPSGGFNIMKWNGSTWADLPNCAGVRIAVAPDGTPWVVNKSSIVYRKTNTELWEPVNGIDAVDIGIGADGTVVVTGKDQRLYKYANGGWVLVPGAVGVNVAVSPFGKPWWTDASNNLFKLN